MDPLTQLLRLPGVPGGEPPVTAKPWGVTRRLTPPGQAPDIWHATIDPRGYCSIHRHLVRDNAFYLLDGELHVLYHDDGPGRPPTKVVRLQLRQFHTVAALRWHRFASFTGAELLEYYPPAESVDPADDIDRYDGGGILHADLDVARCSLKLPPPSKL